MQQTLTFTVFLGLFGLAGSALAADASSAPPATALEDAVTAGCLACHRGALSLAGRDEDPLRLAVAAMSSGQRAHPVPVPALSEADLALLVERLTAPLPTP